MFRTLRKLFPAFLALALSLALTLPEAAPAAPAQATKKRPAQKRVAAKVVAAKPVATPAALPQLAGDGPHLVRLQNGLSVLIKRDDRFPLVNIRMLVHAGSAYETRDQAGISHVLEHMVFKGAGDMKPGEVAGRIEGSGGSLNASTSFDVTTYYVEVPDAAWKMGLSVVRDMTLRPTLDPRELESEKEVVLAELKRGEDTPDNRLFQTVQGMIWKGTSYEWPIIGFTDTVRATTSQKMRAYTAALYQPQNMLLAVVGRVDPAQALAEAERLLGTVPNTRPLAPVNLAAAASGPASSPSFGPAPAQNNGPRLKIEQGMWNKVHVGVAFPSVDFSSSKMAGLDLLCQVLGGDETSRLHRIFKYEKRLVDSIVLGHSNLERGGVLMVHAVLDADKLPAFWEALIAELASFDAGTLTDRELGRARTNIEASLFLAKETLSGLAGKLSHQYFFEGGPQAEANYLEGLASPSRAHLAALYREFFRPERLRAVILAPAPEKGGTKVDPAPYLAALDKRWPVKAEQKQAPAAAAGQVRQIALPGGGTLVLTPDATLPYMALSMAWPGGDGLIEAKDQGLGALTASLLTRGTKARSATELEDYLADRAASLGAGASAEGFSLGAKFPSRFAPDMLELIRETLTSPAFARSELSRAREDQINAIKRGEDQPIGLMFRNLPGLLYASRPHGYLRLGDPARVAAFTGADARAFWARQSRQPFVLAVTGQFDEARLTAFATQLEKDLGVADSPGARYQQQAPVWKPKSATVLRLKDRNQSHIVVLFKTPGREDMAASARLAVLRAALAGQSGLLFRDMRDRQGLGYSVTAFLSQGKKSGFLAFYIGTDPDKRQASFEGFRKAAAELARTPLPAEELSRAKNILSGEYYQDRQSLQSRSSEAASALVAGLPRDAELRLMEAAQAVTAEDVRRTAAEVLTWDEGYVVEVEP